MDLKKKVGPLPIYAWAGIATVAVLAAYFYLRGGDDGAGAAGLTMPDPGAQAIDPTTGLPYSGSGFGGGGGLGIATPDTGTAPALSAEDISAAITAALTDAGMFTAPATLSYDDTGVWDAIAGLQAPLQAPSDHSAPPSPAARQEIVTRPSASHGGALWTYRKRPSDGKLIPIAPVSKPGTTSGAHTAPSGGHASSGQPVAAHPTSPTTSGHSQGADPAQKDWIPVIKNGGFYHYYPDRHGPTAYVYIRPATH